MTSTTMITETMRGATIEILIAADTKDEAEAAVSEYMSRYAYGGYGTSFRDMYPAEDGRWLITGYRYSSC